MSEAQKYQGALYRPEKEKKGNKNANNGPKKAYIEDAPDAHSSNVAIVDAPPEAPMPPSAAPDFQAQTPVNVFDFYVGSATPNPSTLDLAAPPPASPPSAADSGAVVRFSQLEDGSSAELVQYGTGPVPSAAPKTPAAKERKSKSKKDTPASATKSDKKRKRLHVDTSASPSVDRDLEMTDAPPVLHSGLTGGLQKLMAGTFPPSPDYSGDNVEAAAAAAASPASPLKRAKRAKESKKAAHSESGGFSTALMQMITSTKRPAKKSSGAAKEKKKDKEARPKKQPRKLKDGAAQKLLEYKTPTAAGQLVVYAAGEGPAPEDLAGMLLGLVSKGPESDRGVSMNKALKRYHRMRAAGGEGESRGAEEKELWKSLRMRRNDRGEIVLFF